MKKILTIVLFAFVGMSVYASSDYYAKLSVSVHSESTGSGTVYVNKSGTTSQTKSTTTSSGEVSFTVNATPDGNSYFDGWKTLSGSVTVTGNSATMNASDVANDETKATTASIAAIFHKIVGVGTNSKFTIVHTQGGTTLESIPITVHGGTTSLTPDPASANFFECSTVKNDDSGENWTLNITILPAAEDKQSQTITLRTAEGATNTVTFTIKEVQVITLVGAQNGTYDAVQTSLGETHSLSALTDTIPVEIKTANAFAFKFNFTPATGYRLNRLRVTVDGVDSYLYDDIDDGIYTISHTFTDGATIQPEFIPTNYAQFIVLGTDTTIHYNDLDRAISVAQTSTSKVVAVYKKGTAKDVDGVVLPKPASGEYTIPAGITLLVPGTADYKYVLGYLGANDFDSGNTSSCWRKLIVETGTTINVKGNICVFSPVSSKQNFNGQPTKYGQIHLSEGSHIIAESGAKIYAYGYISGDPDDSSVTIKGGAEAFEIFQFTDWRGGSAMLLEGLANNKKEVLPIAQYYVQNIETLLKIQKGGKLNLTTGVDMQGSNLPISAVLVNEMDEVNNSEVQGLFCLGTGTEFHKYYDGENDRQVMTVLGTQLNAKAKFSYIEVAITGSYSLGGFINVPVNTNVDSRNFVLPVSSNMDIVVDNINLTLPYRVAFMPGTSMTIAQNASLTVQNKVYFYDAELNVQPANTAKGYFAAGDKSLLPLNNTAYHNGKPDTTINGTTRFIRLAEYTRYPKELQDAKLDLNGTMTLEGNGALYTTIYDETVTGVTDTSEDVLDSIFGANITSSEGGGTMNYNALGTKDITYQIQQTPDVTYPEIPVHNARLRNADGTFAGGENAKVGETYMYFIEDGKWYVPDVGIPTWINNKFNLTLPKDTVQNVICPVVVHGVTITGMEVSVSGSQFAKAGNHKYEADTLTIPVKYMHLNKHNVGTPNEGSIAVTINYNDPLTGAQTKTVTIPLSATEDYTPIFSVAIVRAPGDTVIVKDGDAYSMLGYVNKPTIADVVITPAQNNVAQSLATWNRSIASPFAFEYGATLDKSQLTYTPTAVGAHTGTLTLTASYTDATTPTPQVVDTTITINLNATASRSNSSLAFLSNLATTVGDTIRQGEVIEAILANTGNSNPVSFTIDDAATHELLSIQPYNGNYRLTANEVDEITEPRTVKIVAMQETDAAMWGDTLTIQLTILPPVTWNWATLYFGSTTTTPPVDVEGTNWTLTEKTDAANLITLATDPTNGYKATVGTPADATKTYTAEFTFRQEGYTKVFTSNIFEDPRAVDYCVDNERTYKAVTLATNPTTSITFNGGVVSFASSAESTASWTLELKGVPDQLTFTPLVSDNAWRIEEYNGTSWTTTYALDNIAANVPFTHSLLPNTQQIRITYAAGAVSTGQLSNVCITKLENVKANTDKVYIPIAKDADGVVVPTTRKLVLYSVNPADLTISFSSSNITSDATTLPAKTGAYTRQEVTLTNTGNSEDVVYLYVKNGATTLLTLPIRPFEFRQGLPIDLASDDAERYHFLTTPSASDRWANTTANVRWDQENRAIVFQNPGVINAVRSVTIAFEGAADYIQFHTSSKVVLTEWTIEESANGEAWGAVDTLKTAINNDMGIRQELHYTTRYVRITYTSQDLSKLLITNLQLEGTPHLMANPTKITLNDDVDNQGNIGLLTLTAINLQQIRVESDDPANFKIIYDGNNLDDQVSEFTATANDYPHALGTNKVGDIQLGIAWQVINTIDDATVTIYNDQDNSILAVIDVLGAKGLLTQGNAKTTGLYTGIPDGTRDANGDGVIDAQDKYTYHGADYKDYTYHEVDLTNTFATDGTAMFDYLFVYGPTTTNDRTQNITAPGNGGSLIGSNASTPYYVYKKTANSEGKYVAYQFVGSAESNTSDKAVIKDPTTQTDIITKDTATVYIDVQDKLSVYITGFAPYATTGYTKDQEGVFLFRGNHGDTLDVYLEDCHIFSRNKTKNGNAFYGNKDGGETFSERYARGSGGVLVFENTDAQQLLNNYTPFEVNIHTMGNNLLKSNYGCFYILLGSMKAYQISAPIHVHLNSAAHVRMTKTTLNFDDLWPTALDANNIIIDSKLKRTNGYLGLKKQSNNAPSIDLGSPLTVANFNGGQIELQNAQIVSENYKTTLAISYRSGEYGADDLGIKLSYGIGTDSVGGTVNFYDGTVTVEPMWVKEGYKQYYLIDTLSDGSEVKKNVGTEAKPIYEYQTSCLRTPKNTYVYGGSLCFLRACQHVTSKGGAPKDGPTGKFLGQYVYTVQAEDVQDPNTKLMTKVAFPNSVEGLYDYHTSHGYTYGIKSITPDNNNQLYFWIPDGFGGVKAEEDKFLSTWKACMTEIRAGLGGVVEGGVGGDTPIEPNEEVKYFLYCQIDQNMHDVIGKHTESANGDKTYEYKAPVKVPAVASSYFDGEEYTKIAPTHVSDSLQYEVLSDTAYTITDKVYYVTTATADIWQTFTAPFDVAKIYVVETFSEEELKDKGTRAEILLEQAKHNADFAAFFAVAMAIGATDDFEGIYRSYLAWAKKEDETLGLYSGSGEYNLRQKQELEPYYGSNWRTANFYLNKTEKTWQLQGDGTLDAKWNVITEADRANGVILHKGETYAMLFPYNMGLTPGDNLNNREEWDYWSGKLLIFESTNAPQVINGRDFLNPSKPNNIYATTPATNQVVVTGNSTFACFTTQNPDAYIYSSGAPNIGREAFYPNTEENEDGDFVASSAAIWPTTAFLYGQIPTNEHGMPARRILRTGEIIYGKDNTATGNPGGNIPTVGGGNDLFITSTVEGINIAVAEPQHVRVLSSTGAVLYSGMVQTAVDVALPTTGVYVITGENEVHKILH